MSTPIRSWLFGSRWASIRSIRPSLSSAGRGGARGLAPQGTGDRFEPLEPRLLLSGDISGTVFNDLDADGARSAGVETGLAGQTIYLDQNLNGRFDTGEPTALTDLNGRYRFNALADGDYIVRQSLPDGAVQTSPDVDPPGHGDLTLAHTIFDEQGEINGLGIAQSPLISPDGLHLYVAGRDTNNLPAIAHLVRDPATNEMTFQDDPTGQANLDATVMAMSPDGRHIYAVGQSFNSLVAYARDATTGTLTFVEAFQDKDVVNASSVATMLDGLSEIRDVVVSPDGRYVYIASHADDALVVFGRDTNDGTLSIAQVLQDPSVIATRKITGATPAATIQSLKDLATAAATGGGHHLYTATEGFGNNQDLSVFFHDPGTGALAFIAASTFRHVNNAVFGRAQSMTVTPDGGQVIVAWDSGASGVTVLDRDASAGTLTHVQTLSGSRATGRPAGGLSVSGDGLHLYLTSSIYDSLTVFAWDDTTGDWQFAQDFQDETRTFIGFDIPGATIIDGLKSPRGVRPVVTSPDGTQIYAAVNSQDDAVIRFDRDAAANTHTVAQLIKDNTGGIQGLASAGRAAISPDGRHVYVIGNKRDNGSLRGTLGVFSLDPTSGEPRYIQAFEDSAFPAIDGAVQTPGLDFTRDVKMSPDGVFVYVVTDRDHALLVFRRDAATGELALEHVFQDNLAGGGSVVNGATVVNELLRPTAIGVSPNGEHVYITSSGDDAIAIFHRDPNTGTHSFQGAVVDGQGGATKLDNVHQIIVSHDGASVYVIGEQAVTAFGRTAGSGGLVFLQKLESADTSHQASFSSGFMAASPDGLNLYVLNTSLITFRRDPNNGALTYLGNLQNTDPGGSSLNSATSIAVSPDGANAYTSSTPFQAPGSLSVWRRLPLTGELVLDDVLHGSDPGNDGLLDAGFVAITHDGTRVVATSGGPEANALNVLDRNGGRARFVSRSDCGHRRGRS